MNGLKIYLSNGMRVDIPDASPATIEALAFWFDTAESGEVFQLSLPNQGRTLHIQKCHIVQIESAL